MGKIRTAAIGAAILAGLGFSILGVVGYGQKSARIDDRLHDTPYYAERGVLNSTAEKLKDAKYALERRETFFIVNGQQQLVVKPAEPDKALKLIQKARSNLTGRASLDEQLGKIYDSVYVKGDNGGNDFPLENKGVGSVLEQITEAASNIVKTSQISKLETHARQSNALAGTYAGATGVFAIVTWFYGAFLFDRPRPEQK